MFQLLFFQLDYQYVKTIEPVNIVTCIDDRYQTNNTPIEPIVSTPQLKRH